MLIKRIFAVAGMIAMAACATGPKEPVTGLKSIGVVSALGEHFDMLSIGTTVFNNSDGVGDISDWKINDLVIESVNAELRGRYDLVAVDYPSAEINAEARDKFTGAWIEDTKSKISEMLRDKLKPSSGSAPDAYLIILPASYPTAFRGYPTFVDVGMYSSSLLGDRRSYIYVSAQMALVDARTFAVLRKQGLRSTYQSADMTKRYKNDGFPYWRIDSSVWARDFDSLTEAQKAAIKTAVENYVKDATPNTLHMIGLIPLETPSN